jgi:hypothetical protein
MPWIIDTINFLSIIYVALPLLFLLCIAIYYLAGKTLSKEIWEKLADFGKWYLVSVSIVIAAKMVENGFQERETGLKEMDGFDKYVSIITDTKGIDKRWELCKYFATVTPTKRLKEGWVAYMGSIQKDYEAFQQLQNKEDSLNLKDTLTKADQKQLETINIEKQKYDISFNNNNDQDDYVIVFTSDTKLDQAQFELNKINLLQLESPRIVKRNSLYQTVSGNFDSRAAAQAYLNTIKNKFTSGPYVSKLSRWCPNPVFNGTYYECK